MADLLTSALLIAAAQGQAPTVQIKNGTIQGRFSEPWNQEQYLGIPYAQPPLGSLRFRHPQPINTSFDRVLDATKYGFSCYQFGSNFNLSEDCLTLNVVRPAGYENQTLPVLVWIYGGGLTVGSTADQQYNISGIVNTSTTTSNPFIGVSINYRLGVWGFLAAPTVLAEGNSNAGLLDQRLALQWVQENIGAFGGDPARVTIWGESAGAQSIGLHLHSFGGRDDKLYSAAILESGGPVGTNLSPLPFYNVAYENLTRTVGCPTTWTSQASLDCLRSLTSEQLFNSRYTVVWNPIVDGEFLTDYPSNLGRAGQFVKVPILTGANTDEGISFNIRGITTDQQLFGNLTFWRNYALTPPTIRRILELYPNIPSIGVPYRDTTNTTFPNLGLQYRRSASIGGDIVIIAQSRKTAEQFVNNSVTDVYRYRFDVPLWNATSPIGSKHFDNVVFSFQNISGALGPLPKYQSYKDLSLSIGKAYANFVGTYSPNGRAVGGGGYGNATSTNSTGLPEWPAFTIEDPRDMVLNSNGSFVEPDTFRKEGIAFINSISRELLA
ncbi:Alpha/Beta hydrolase protein [Elsinoe ampelina]|uniref:Carboxylic ester hydrolase n=1 Tax=Elsinoe ampelina TaxID=302913 RepID=A0A6A6G393_9PEZI|nr:Alpha/Beta hydrolase protein [Elsinoe ampelina]